MPCRFAGRPFDLGVKGSGATPLTRRNDRVEVHAHHAWHRRDQRQDDGDAVRGDAGDRRALQRGADPGRGAGRRRGTGRPVAGRGGRLLGRDAGGDGWTVRGNEGIVRRFLHPRRRLEGGGDRVGQAAAGLPGHQGRGPPGAEHRRVPAGQRVDRQGAGVARAHGSALRTLEAVWRMESARIVGALARYTRDFSLAEDVAQEALAEALVAWERDGEPADPVGWLLATARRRAIDAFRRRSALDERYQLVARETGTSAEMPWDPDRIDDDILALIFIACHPVLAAEARVALTLRTV